MLCCDNGHTFINIIFSMENTAKRTILYCGNFSKRFFLPLPLKLLESEIWDIRDCFSLIIMYTFKIKDYNDNKNN